MRIHYDDVSLLSTEKHCNKCGELKPLIDFRREPKVKSGFLGTCKSCVKGSPVRNHPILPIIDGEKACSGCEQWKPIKAYSIERGKLRARCNACSFSTGQTRRQKNLALLIQQDYRCAICQVQKLPKDVNVRNGLHLDHCHATNKIRQFLCRRCNVMLGHAHDLPELLREAANYLERHQ